VGHTLCAIVGVCITKLFALSSDYDGIEWVAGAVATGVASSVMLMTNTIHPPGGATALLAATEPVIRDMGWWFIPLVLLATVLMLGVALLVNNIQRRYPAYWWTAADVGRKQKPDIEHADAGAKVQKEQQLAHTESMDCIMIGLDDVVLPPGFGLGPEQEGVLEILRDQLREWSESRRRHGGGGGDGLAKPVKAASRSGSESEGTAWDGREPP